MQFEGHLQTFGSIASLPSFEFLGLCHLHLDVSLYLVLRSAHTTMWVFSTSIFGLVKIASRYLPCRSVPSTYVVRTELSGHYFNVVHIFILGDCGEAGVPIPGGRTYM